MKSIKVNFIYTSILTCANYLFPLIVYPYVSRVLGVTSIGACNFVDSVVNYFVLISMMGVNVVGTREIAKANGDKEKLSKCFSGIFWINTILTAVALLIYVICIITVPKLQDYSQLTWIGVPKILFGYLCIEWLYNGLEEFKYITIRALIVRVLYVISIFVFVKDESDYWIYFLLMTMITIVNALINIRYSRHFVRLKIYGLNLKPFIGPLLIMGLYKILTSLYTTFNVTYLGFVTDDTEVGYYITASKFFSVILSLYSALTAVMLPRMSSLLSEGKIEQYKSYISATVNLLLVFSCPIILFSIAYAPELILLLSGVGYEGAILPMRIMMILVFVIGYEQVLVIQSLMPLGKDKCVLKNSIVGALVAIVLNVIVVPNLASVGSAIVWLISEIVVLMMAQCFLTKYTGITFPWKYLSKNILYHLPLAALLLLSLWLPVNQFVRMSIGMLITVAYIVILQLLILKNSLIIDNVQKLPLVGNFFKKI